MIKVFENFDFSRVGQMQSLLESHGIRTFIRNQYGSSVMGEVPFVEVVPQLFVLRNQDVERAIELLQVDLPEPLAGDNWVCAACSTEVEAVFNCCWSCGAERDNT